MDIVPFDDQKYTTGVNLILECYLASQHQCGGGIFSMDTLSAIGDMLGKVFSDKARAGITRVVRGTLRTSSGTLADVLTLGGGGDTIVNVVFAVTSSMGMSKRMATVIAAFNEAKPLFKKLFIVDTSLTIPIRSKLNLDRGFQAFETDFVNNMNEYIAKYGTKTLEKAYRTIMDVIGYITKVVSDWVACLFPDTAGLAGEITRTILNFIVLNGYTYVYNLVSILTDKMQRLITDTIGLKKFSTKAITYFRNLIRDMDPQEFANFAQAIGDAWAGLFDNALWKNYTKFSTAIGKTYYKMVAKTYNAVAKLPLVPNVNEWLVAIIDKFMLPYVGICIDIFAQMMPVFLMFTLFIEKYETIISPKSNE